MERVKFGSTFSAEAQDVSVNVWAQRIKEDGFLRGEFTVRYGDRWYFVKLPHAGGTFSEEEYLIFDDVGSDGWGGVTIFRNIQWLADNEDNAIPHKQKVSW